MNQTTTRIGLCTDTHNWTPSEIATTLPDEYPMMRHTGELQALLLEELARAELDLVLHLGDFACGGSNDLTPEAFFNLEETIFRDFAALPASVYGLPGNHDSPPDGGDTRFFERLWGLERGLGRAIATPQARLILLHTQGHSPEQIAAAAPESPVHGWVGEDELERLDAELSNAGDRPVLLFMHQLICPWSGEQPWDDLFGVGNAAAVHDILARHGNVRAVFQGHAHRFDVQRVAVGGRPCHFVVTPAIADYPVAWLELELTDRQVSVRLRQLPAPQLVEFARLGRGGQDWRAGKPAWHTMTFDLCL